MLWIRQQEGGPHAQLCSTVKRALPHSRVVLSTEAEFGWLLMLRTAVFFSQHAHESVLFLVEKSKRDVQISGLA